MRLQTVAHGFTVQSSVLPERPPTGITSQSFLLAKHGVLLEQVDHGQMESEGSRRQEKEISPFSFWVGSGLWKTLTFPLYPYQTVDKFLNAEVQIAQLCLM